MIPGDNFRDLLELVLDTDIHHFTQEDKVGAGDEDYNDSDDDYDGGSIDFDDVVDEVGKCDGDADADNVCGDGDNVSVCGEGDVCWL